MECSVFTHAMLANGIDANESRSIDHRHRSMSPKERVA